eukprot:TCONS_00008549-protein
MVQVTSITAKSSNSKVFILFFILLTVTIFKDSIFCLNREYQNVRNIQVVQPGHDQPTFNAETVVKAIGKLIMKRNEKFDSKLKQMQHNTDNSMQKFLQLLSKVSCSVLNETIPPESTLMKHQNWFKRYILMN